MWAQLNLCSWEAGVHAHACSAQLVQVELHRHAHVYACWPTGPRSCGPVPISPVPGCQTTKVGDCCLKWCYNRMEIQYGNSLSIIYFWVNMWILSKIYKENGIFFQVLITLHRNEIILFKMQLIALKKGMSGWAIIKVHFGESMASRRECN